MQGEPTPPLMESPVKNGLTRCHMTTSSPMWEITTFVGTLLEIPNLRYGATQLILNTSDKIVQFLSAPY